MDQQRLDRIRGCLTGFSLGDALGAPWEFERKPISNVPARFYAGAFGTLPGQGTDDSAMARAAAEAFLSTNCAATTSIYMNNLVKWFDNGPADIGNQTLSAVLAWKEQRPINEGAKGGEGNGGLFTAHVCAAFGQSISAAAFAQMTHPARVVRSLASSLSLIINEALNYGTLSQNFNHHLRPLVRPWDTNIGHAPVTFTIAYQAAQMTGGDPESALPVLIHTIQLGGDTDSNAAVTGGLLGAIYGMAAWKKFPELDKLEELDYWLSVADQAADR